MTMKDKLVEFGRMRGEMGVMPRLAYYVAEQTAKGEVGPEDAMDIYTTYYSSTGFGRKVKVHKQSPNIKVQASKLRQIIKASELDGTELLDRVIAAHRQSTASGVQSLYNMMVEASRLRLSTGKPLSDWRIKEIVHTRK